MAVRLHLDAVRGEEGAVVCDFKQRFAGIVLPVERYPASAPSERVRAFAAVPPIPQTRVLPARAVRVILGHLAQGRPVVRGWIGARFTVSGTGAERYVCVKSTEPDHPAVEEGGPAARSGLRGEDVLVEANGKPVATIGDLYDLAFWVEYEGPGNELDLAVRRGTEVMRLVIPVAPRPKPDPAAGADR
jgi:S1-C subfamily serine protease